MESKTPPKTQRSAKLQPGFGAAGKPGFIGAADCERLTGITRQTWTAWAKQGKFTSVRLGKRWLIPVVEFERLLTENTLVHRSEGGVSPAKQQESSIS
jgi:hypothetical protein